MIGMLWFDNDKEKPLETKINEAAAFYRKKYGAAPDTCLVPLNSECQAPAGITVTQNRSIRPGHLLIGLRNGIQKSL